MKNLLQRLKQWLYQIWVLRILRILTAVSWLLYSSFMEEFWRDGDYIYIRIILLCLLLAFDIIRFSDEIGKVSIWIRPEIPMAFDGLLAFAMIAYGSWDSVALAIDMSCCIIEFLFYCGPPIFLTSVTGLLSGLILFLMYFKELPVKKSLRHLYRTAEPIILYTDSGDAVAVFPEVPQGGLELLAMHSVDSLLQENDGDSVQPRALLRSASVYFG